MRNAAGSNSRRGQRDDGSSGAAGAGLDSPKLSTSTAGEGISPKFSTGSKRAGCAQSSAEFEPLVCVCVCGCVCVRVCVCVCVLISPRFERGRK